MRKNLDTEENREIGDIGKSERQDISPQITQMGAQIEESKTLLRMDGLLARG